VPDGCVASVSDENLGVRIDGCVTTTTTTVLRPFFRDHPGELVPEENFWTLWSKGRLTETDTPTIRLGASPSGLSSAQLHHPPIFFLQARCLSCSPTNSIKTLKATKKKRRINADK